MPCVGKAYGAEWEEDGEPDEAKEEGECGVGGEAEPGRSEPPTWTPTARRRDRGQCNR